MILWRISGNDGKKKLLFWSTIKISWIRSCSRNGVVSYLVSPLTKPRLKPVCHVTSTTSTKPVKIIKIDHLGLFLSGRLNEPHHKKTCICGNKDADKLRGNRAADQRLCFRYTDSTIPILSKSKVSKLLPSSVAVQPSLCRTWSETQKTGFLTIATRLKQDVTAIQAKFDLLSKHQPSCLELFKACKHLGQKCFCIVDTNADLICRVST